MSKCKRCGNDLSSNGFCHMCLSYDQSAPSNIDFEQVCNICNQYFTDRDEYLEHLRSHPMCDYCKERFNSETELHKHLKTHECPICHLYFNIVTRHKKQHSQCDLCKEWFLDKKALNEHFAQHPQCEYCKDRFKSDNNLQIHRETEHKCPACNLYYHPILEHLKQHSYCGLCKKWFLDEIEYNKHLAKHPQCKYCGKKFNTHVDLANHIDSIHKCSVCYGYFTNVQLHMKSEHIYCRVCHRYFIDNYQYERNHLKCQYCGEIFENRSRLENHISISHCCIVCKTYFHSSKELEIHMRNIHPMWALVSDFIHDMYSLGGSKKKSSKNIKCSYCDKLFTTESSRNQHIKDMHPNHNAKLIPVEEEIEQLLAVTVREIYETRIPLSNKFDDVIRRAVQAEIDINIIVKLREIPQLLVNNIPSTIIMVKLQETQQAFEKYIINMKCPYCGRLFTTESSRNHHIRYMHPNHKNTSKYQGIAGKSEVEEEINQILTIKVRELYEERKSLPSKINNIIEKAVQAGIDINIIVKLREIQQQLVTDVSNMVLIKKIRETQQDIKGMKCPYCDKLFTTESGRNQHIKDKHSIA